MSKKKLLPNGTTWREAYDAFGELASSEFSDVASAAQEEQYTLEQIGSADTAMELEPQILVGFRRKYIDILKLQEER